MNLVARHRAVQRRPDDPARRLRRRRADRDGRRRTVPAAAGRPAAPATRSSQVNGRDVENTQRRRRTSSASTRARTIDFDGQAHRSARRRRRVVDRATSTRAGIRQPYTDECGVEQHQGPTGIQHRRRRHISCRSRRPRRLREAAGRQSKKRFAELQEADRRRARRRGASAAREFGFRRPDARRSAATLDPDAQARGARRCKRRALRRARARLLRVPARACIRAHHRDSAAEPSGRPSRTASRMSFESLILTRNQIWSARPRLRRLAGHRPGRHRPGHGRGRRPGRLAARCITLRGARSA